MTFVRETPPRLTPLPTSPGLCPLQPLPTVLFLQTAQQSLCRTGQSLSATSPWSHTHTLIRSKKCTYIYIYIYSRGPRDEVLFLKWPGLCYGGCVWCVIWKYANVLSVRAIYVTSTHQFNQIQDSVETREWKKKCLAGCCIRKHESWGNLVMAVPLFLQARNGASAGISSAGQPPADLYFFRFHGF